MQFVMAIAWLGAATLGSFSFALLLVWLLLDAVFRLAGHTHAFARSRELPRIGGSGISVARVA